MADVTKQALYYEEAQIGLGIVTIYGCGYRYSRRNCNYT